MDTYNRKAHWENIYNTKELKDVSWYQDTPTTSLNFIEKANLPKSAKIVDVGGGDSLLVDHLLQLGYYNITIVDISEVAINRAKKRLGALSEKVKWIVGDIADFNPTENYDLWHDRAAFHFLTTEKEINAYVQTVHNSLNKNGVLILATFSEDGPLKCSGIEIKQYSESTMSKLFVEGFKKDRCETINHTTPFNTIQNFVFCSFTKVKSLINHIPN